MYKIRYGYSRQVWIRSASGNVRVLRMYSSEYASSAWLASIDPTFWSPGVTVQFRGKEYEEEANYNPAFSAWATIYFLDQLRIGREQESLRRQKTKLSSPLLVRPLLMPCTESAGFRASWKDCWWDRVLCADASLPCAGAPQPAAAGQSGLAWCCTHGSVWPPREGEGARAHPPHNNNNNNHLSTCSSLGFSSAGVGE